jgi:hypothetical protein
LIDAFDYKAARDKYRPSSIDVLWIAESPPAGGGYFYFEVTSGRNHLFRETMKALGWWPLDFPMHAGLDKSPYLKRFQEGRHFLIDLSPTPVNKLSPTERHAELRRNIIHISEEIETLRPAKILLIKRNVFDILSPLLQSSKLTLNREFIPFPSHGWQAEYRQRIQQLIPWNEFHASP